MAGLLPAIHVLPRRKEDVDARHRGQVCASPTITAGHDELA